MLRSRDAHKLVRLGHRDDKVIYLRVTLVDLLSDALVLLGDRVGALGSLAFRFAR